MENTSLKTTASWHTINWAKVQRKVFRLQKQIFQAVKSGDKAKAHNLQKLLMKSYYAKLLAIRRVTQDNQGRKTAGVDGRKVLNPNQRLKLINELKTEGYKTKPLRRVWIPKPGRDEKRPLGIPTIKDRAMQALVKLAIEPFWEAQFEEKSYGFRPGRNTHDAIAAIFNHIRFKPKYVLDADISKCFDKIDHQKLLNKLDCPKVSSKLIKQWLKAGVLDNNTLEKTDKGTPQGGVVSPLLANIALHGMISDIEKSFPESFTLNGKRYRNQRPSIIRYADDFVVLHHDLNVINQCKKLIEAWLRKMGLELKPEKTRICHTLDITEIEGTKTEPGFDFLGFHIRQFRVGKYHSGKNAQSEPLGFKTIIKPSKKAIKNHYQKLRDTINKNRKSPQAVLINHLNPIIRGWCNYYRTVVSKEVFSKMDDRLWSKLRGWTVSRATKKNRKNNLLATYFRPGKHGTWTFQTKTGITIEKHAKVDIIRHTLVRGNASPYNGDWAYWSTRRGNYTDTPKRVSLLLKKQKGRCNLCGQHFTSEDLVEIDHIQPLSKGGKDEYKNLQLLHRHCHNIKTRHDGTYEVKTTNYEWVGDILTVPMTTAG